MSGFLKATLMVLGAVCVLLLAGAFPLMGAPEVYRSGAMLVVGVLAGLLCASGGWRLAKGVRLRFAGGLLCTFFAAAGAAAVWMFGAQGVENAKIGGAMWFGAVAMFCLAAVGSLFLCVFGFLAWRAMYRRLWLAALHWALALMVLGAFLDYGWEVRVPLRMVAGIGRVVSEVEVDGEKLPLGFSLDLEKFSVAYYESTTYTLCRRENGEWTPVGKPERQGDALVLDDRRWLVADLRTSPNMPGPFLLQGEGDAMELLMQDPAAVRDYCATCKIVSDHRGRKEIREVDIRVNEPLSFKGWVIHLSSHRPMGGTHLVEFVARRAPGRLLTLGGMIGLIITTACWCWKRREDEPQPDTKP